VIPIILYPVSKLVSKRNASL